MHSFKESVYAEWLLSVGYYSKGWGCSGKQNRASSPWRSYTKGRRERTLWGKELCKVISEMKNTNDNDKTKETHQQKHQEWLSKRDSLKSQERCLWEDIQMTQEWLGRVHFCEDWEKVSRIKGLVSMKAPRQDQTWWIPGTERRLFDLREVSQAVGAEPSWT